MWLYLMVWYWLVQGLGPVCFWFNVLLLRVEANLFFVFICFGKLRWGTATHIVFLVFCLATNVVVTAMLLLGGSAVVNALTGVNIYAASFLIPLGVIVYTLAGGLKATFLASYVHSVIGNYKPFNVHILLELFHIHKLSPLYSNR